MENHGSYESRSYILSALTRGSRVHLVGILGAGMSPLAELLVHKGITVTGTDTAGGARAEALRSLGISLVSHHTADGLDGADLVVYSLAVPPDCPELAYARRAGIPAVTRAELLGALMSLYPRSVTVSGTHGKSTTVGMLDLIFRTADLDPTVISGATLTDGEAQRIGHGDLILAEACEYRSAFHHLTPTLALVTNIELDHTDCFPTEQDVYDAFLAFSMGADTVLLNLDCPLSRRLASERGVRALTYGTADADYPLLYSREGSDGTDFLVRLDGAVYDFHLSVLGRGNLYDALGAIAVSHRLGIPVSNIKTALAVFGGIGRRLEPIAEINGRRIYYDYAHHPTEIKNTLATLGMLHGRVAVIFRPHTYSRTAALMDDFAAALRGATDAVILDIYPAREAPIDGVSAAALAERIGGSATALADSQALEYLLAHPSDAIVLMGAGEVDNILEQIGKYKKQGE